MGQIKAPRIKNLVYGLNDAKYTVDVKTSDIINQIYDELDRIKACGEDNRHELWLRAERGAIEDFGNYDEWLEDEMVNNYEEFVQWWEDEYPEEEIWFNLVTIKRDDYEAIFLDKKLIYQSRTYAAYDYNIDLTELFTWMLGAVKKCIVEMEKGTYNSYVSANLNVFERTGIINRKDYWDVFPEYRDNYFQNITKQEIDRFVTLITEQNDEPVGEYLESMTANKFYAFCNMGYIANNYSGSDKLTAKEMYYKYADGRVDGLDEIDDDSESAFDNWLNDNKRFGGHPWEVCRGGNSTHVGLYVMQSEKGYYLRLEGKSWSRSVETIKFYIALRESGVAVYLGEAKGILDRLLEQDIIGIVPHGVTPVYCSNWFPNHKMLDYINLPYERTELLLPHITWLKETEQFLVEKN